MTAGDQQLKEKVTPMLRLQNTQLTEGCSIWLKATEEVFT